MNIDFPFPFDAQGRTATTDDDDHIRDMIEQLLFTCARRAREPIPISAAACCRWCSRRTAPELAAALQFTMQAAVQRYLGDLIDLQQLAVTAQDATLSVTVSYVDPRHPAVADEHLRADRPVSGTVAGCRIERRREQVREAPLLGIDFVEVGAQQTMLEVFFLGRAPAKLEAANVVITGGAVRSVSPA